MTRATCLVLGGGGFIGSHACEALLRAGHRVTVFERRGAPREHLRHVLSDVEWLEGDFTRIEDLRDVVPGHDVVLHAVCTTQPSNGDAIHDVVSNVVPTLAFLELARTAGVKRVVFLSSGGTVYGVPTRIPIPEDHPNQPICSYGVQKLAIERYLHLYDHLHQLDHRVLRVSNPYGERQQTQASQGAVMVFLYRALRGEPIEIWGDGSVTRDYVHVSDVADALVRVVDHTGPARVFNVGSGRGLSLLALIREIEAVVGRRVDVRFSAPRRFDVPANVLDIRRAREELGWEPTIALADGLRRTMDWLERANGGAA